jgi:hypothetical protein
MWFGYRISGHLGIFFTDGNFFSSGATAHSGPGPPNYRGFTITLKHTPHSVGLLWTSDQPVAETSTWHHTTLTRDRPPCPLRHSNPQSQQASGRRPTSYTAQQLGSATLTGMQTWIIGRGRNRIRFYGLRLTVDENWHPRPPSVRYSCPWRDNCRSKERSRL